MTVPETLDVAVRAWTGEAIVRRGRPSRRHKPTAMVVVDAETDLTTRQGLLVLSYRYLRIAWKGNVPSFTVAEEGLVHRDDDEGTRRFLLNYAAGHPAEVDPATGGSPNLLVLSRADFCERIIWQACWRSRATMCGFNLRFDISRLALSHHAKRTDPSTVVFRLWEHDGDDNRFRPNEEATRLDNKRTILHHGAVVDPPDDGFEHAEADDHFLDCRTLAFAHTNASHTLESACATFGVPYVKAPVVLGTLSTDLVDYCREDVTATAELAGALLEVHHRHPIPVSADRAYSPASLGLGYLRRMNVRPPRAGTSKLSTTELAQAQAAFIGQRTEVRIRHHEMPVRSVDFSSQYAVVAQLFDLWRLVTSEELLAVECTESAQRLLDQVDLDWCHDPADWPKLRFFAEIEPDRDWLPVRAAFAGTCDVSRVGFGPVTSNRPMWYAGPDLADSKLVTGRAPRVLRAWRLVGRGRQAKLYPARLAGVSRFHPAHGGLWAALVAVRHQLGDDPGAEAAKVIANALAYGVWLRADRQETAGRQILHQPDGRDRAVRVEHPEDHHLWSFPPFASLVTAGGRLLLGMLGAHLAADGGLWASANTDSATIVSTEHGGAVPCPGGPLRMADGAEAVRAVSWARVDEIAHRFESLNPDPTRPLLKIEPENFDSNGRPRQLYATAVSGGRVFLTADGPDGRRKVVKRSEVNLGDLRAPEDAADFLDDFATWAVAFLGGEERERPWWWELPANTFLGVGTPGKAVQLGGLVSPFGFAMGARTARRAGAVVGGERVRLLAPLTPVVEASSAPWVEVPSGRPVRVLSAEEVNERREHGGWFTDDEMVLDSLGRTLLDWIRQPETKMLGPDGRPCRSTTRGLLTPRPVRVGKISFVGRESNRLDEVAAGEVTDPNEVVTTFADDEWEGLLVPVLRTMRTLEAERRGAGRRERLAAHIANGTVPRSDSLARVRQAAVAWAAEQLATWGRPATGSPTEVLVAYLDADRDRSRCTWPGCDTATTSRWCEMHRQRSGADRQKALAVIPKTAGGAAR